MKKSAFTLIEIIFVFALVLIVSALVIPLAINDSKTMQNVSAWRHSYEDILYAFQSMGVNGNNEYKNEIELKISKAKNIEDINTLLINEFSPYLRIDSELVNKRYVPRYFNYEKVKEGQYYYFDKFYTTQNGQVIALKWLKDLYDNSPLIVFMLDTNGVKGPNVWGKDIFGMNIYKDKTEPFGKNISKSEVDLDCSKKGRGVYCSYKYLIGAQF